MTARAVLAGLLAFALTVAAQHPAVLRTAAVALVWVAGVLSGALAERFIRLHQGRVLRW